MTFQNPDRISLEISKKTEVSPLWAILEVTIEGEASFSGNESFRKAKEVATFVDALKQTDYDEAHVSLENVVIKTSTGVLTKSSSARFELKLDKIPLKQLSSVLSVVARQKNISINSVDYDFGALEKEKSELMEQACLAAKEEGLRVCSFYGVELLGIYSMAPSWSLPDMQSYEMTRSSFGKSRRSEMEGLDIIENKKDELLLALRMEFRVGGFKDV